MPEERNQPTAVWSQSEIQRILPHRYPFLLVDRVVEFIPSVRIAALKHFSGGDDAAQGHFPDAPVVPGGILIEALTQLGAILVLEQPEMTGKVAVILGIPSARMLQPVHPGETLRLEAEVMKLRSTYGELRGKAYRECELVAEGQIRFGVTSRSALLSA